MKTFEQVPDQLYRVFGNLPFCGLHHWLVDPFQYHVQKLFAACSYESRVARKYAHHQACAKITSQSLRHLRWGEALHQVKGAVPLLVAVVGDALINHVGDVHVASETRPPGFVETPKEICGGIARFDRFGCNVASHLTSINGEANALAYQGRTLSTCIASQHQAITRETLKRPFRWEQAGITNECISSPTS